MYETVPGQENLDKRNPLRTGIYGTLFLRTDEIMRILIYKEP